MTVSKATPVKPATLKSGAPARRTNLNSIATRAKLVAVAERLYAQHGIEGVSLSEINRASKQRNANACQYHFGNKQGLLQAIVDKHVPSIAARRNQLLDQFELTGELDLPALIHTWVLPVAEKLQDSDGGSDFIRINAQLTAAHALAVQNPAGATLHAQGAERLARLLNQALKDLPEPVRQQRLLMASVLLFHGLADQSRLLESISEPSFEHDNLLYIANLEDAITAMLIAPVTPRAFARLEQLQYQEY